MAPNKFEKQIKEQLEEREIAPSTNAWDKLSEKMDVTTSQSKKRTYVWYAIAASVIGFLIVSVIYFNGLNVTKNSYNHVVETEEKIIEPTNVDGIKQKDIEEYVVQNEKIFKKKSTTSKAFEVDERIVKKDKFILEMDDTLQAISPEYASTEQVSIVVADRKVRLIETVKTEEVLNNKILEVVAQVDSIEKQNIDLTDIQVDSLLRFAQKEIIANKLFLSENKIDPMVLLTDVEDELDQSFRDKIFERLRTGFTRVRTGVVENEN